MTAEGSTLLLVDLQERRVAALPDGAELVATAARLAAGARLLDVPVAGTEQVPDELGPTVPQLAEFPQLVMPRTTFAAASGPGAATLLPPGTEEVVVAGAEAHGSVLQTVLGLLAARRRVLLVADAVASRRAVDREVAVDRMRRHGAEVVTAEMVLLEWLGDALHPRYAEVAALLSGDTAA